MNAANLYAVFYPVKTGPRKVRAELNFPRYHAEMQASRKQVHVNAYKRYGGIPPGTGT